MDELIKANAGFNDALLGLGAGLVDVTKAAVVERRRKRLLSALAKHGWSSVKEAAQAVDKGSWEAIKGVGPVLAKVMREWLAESVV